MTTSQLIARVPSNNNIIAEDESVLRRMDKCQNKVGSGKISRTFTILVCLLLSCTTAWAAEAKSFVSTIQGTGTNLPPRYVMPLLSNGSLSIHFDIQGTQALADYNTRADGILWQGRRVGPPKDALFSFGHYRQEISYGGKTYTSPDRWSQTLDAGNAEIVCMNEYGDALTVKTEIIVHATHDIVAIRKTFRTSENLREPIRYRFCYNLSSQPDRFTMPRRMSFTPRWNAETESIDIGYTAIGERDYEGIISLMSNAPAIHDESLERLSLQVEVKPEKGKEATIDFYILYADNLATGDYPTLMAEYRKTVKEGGYEGLLASHRKTWTAHWEKTKIEIPDKNLERAYIGGIYQLLTNATRWTFPVGIGLWEGRYFAFDETYCYLGLASSNHLDIARRAPEFRRKYLERACGRTRNTGARYPWETTEDGLEGAPQPYGHWYDHVFHMSHIATAAWTHYLYTCDKEYLRNVAFPVMKECSRFFMRHMCYEHPDGSITFGKTTDLERLGGAVENPFFSSCGAIYTFESTVKAAAILGIDDDLYSQYARMAEGLRKTLPNDGQKYIPYKGCPENSIATVTGMYPYPVLSTDDPMERAAVQHFYNERYKAGNMYAVGNGLCPWYASWMASAMANYGERDKSLSLLQEAAAQIGYFSEHFEINEKDVVRNPWFTTAAGNYVHALDQTLLLNRDDDVFLCYSAPIEWKDYAFTLPAYGNILVSAEVRKGKLRSCTLSPNQWSSTCNTKTLWIPSSLIDEKRISKLARKVMQRDGDYYKFGITLTEGQTLSILTSH